VSRSGYVDDFDDDHWQFIRWRGAVKSAMRGKRGQAFLKEMLAALDALPEKRLIADSLEEDGEVCAIGSVGKQRGIDMSKIDPEDYSSVAGAFQIAEAMSREIQYMNDEWFDRATPEERFTKMRAWIVSQIKTSEANP